MNYKIALLPGDGIGPEVIEQAVKVLEVTGEAAGHRFSFTEGLVGAMAIDRTGNPFPDETLAICRSADAILFGAIGHPTPFHHCGHSSTALIAFQASSREVFFSFHMVTNAYSFISAGFLEDT